MDFKMLIALFHYESFYEESLVVKNIVRLLSSLTLFFQIIFYSISMLYSHLLYSLEIKYLHKCSENYENDILITAQSYEYSIDGQVTHICNLQNISETIHPIISRSIWDASYFGKPKGITSWLAAARDL